MSLKSTIPDDSQWRIDSGSAIAFKVFLKKFECLDKLDSEQRYNNIPIKYVEGDINNQALIEYQICWLQSILELEGRVEHHIANRHGLYQVYRIHIVSV